MSADLYAVLVAKLTGEYLELVLMEKGNGAKGLHEVHRWCMLQTEEGLMARLKKLENPERAKSEADVYQRVTSWVRELREIVRIGKNLEMDDRYKIIHLKKILVGKTKEVIEQRLSWRFSEFLDTVKAWGGA